MKKILITLISTSIFFNCAFAARISRGRSAGMQRSYQSRSYQNNSYQQPRSNTYSPPSQPQQGGGIGRTVGAAAAGAAVGAVGGYMLGKSMNNNEANNQQQQNMQESNQVQQQQAIAPMAQSSESNINWGIIGILVILLIIGITIFRRKATPTNNNAPFNNNFNNNVNNNNNGFTIPRAGNNKNTPPPITKMQDGNESSYFLRQAKGMFLHIQSMNNRDNIGEIEKYLTVELFNEISDQISNNQSVADFTELNCELVEDVLEENNYIASVLFSGMVSEEANANPVPFNETWNFVKPTNSEKWIVAGIQQ